MGTVRLKNATNGPVSHTTAAIPFERPRAKLFGALQAATKVGQGVSYGSWR